MEQKNKLSREELANIEVGNTEVSRRCAMAFCFLFLLVIFLVPFCQLVMDIRDQTDSVFSKSRLIFATKPLLAAKGHETFVSRVVRENKNILAGMAAFEDELEQKSFLRDIVLYPGQLFLLRVLGKGNEKVVTGRDDWLFYSADMDYVVGPGFLEKDWQKKRGDQQELWEKSVQPDPVKGIVRFKEQLEERGIALIVVPTPLKQSIHPEKVSAGLAGLQEPVRNRSFKAFVKRLQKKGVTVFDPAPVLKKYADNTGRSAYLRTDTHWRPEAMELVAEDLAGFIHAELGLNFEETRFKQQPVSLENRGDIENMLDLKGYGGYRPEKITVNRVVTEADEIWSSSRKAEILLLGDSFSNIFSFGPMGWGEYGGLSEQLSYSLQTELDTIVQNDDGSYVTRQLLSNSLARGEDRLAEKKLVIWQFAERELAQGNWKELGLDYLERGSSEFFVVEGKARRKVRGRIVEISRFPLPGTVPYKDNLITLHLSELVDAETGEQLGDALVYGWGMKNNILSKLSKKRSGQEIEIELSSWDMVEEKYSSFRRSTLQDDMVEYEIPNWGE